MKLTILLLCVLATRTLAQDKELADEVKELKETLSQLSRQVMLQQFYLEEKVRSDGVSGIKAIRANKDGTKNYYDPSHLDERFCSIHDHANYDRTVGMGEMLLAMNGVEFKTRHNDYKLRMPSTKEATYNKMEDIPFSPVPPSVLNKTTIEEQVEEMQQYFKAFKQQDTGIRDYKPYFKPVMCYVEGTWTSNTKSVDEPFQSDRHSIDASNWMELMEKVRFTSYTGSKSVNENYSFLPTTIMEVIDGVPHYAQWNYRILCHPLQGDLPTKVFKRHDDLKNRFANRLKWGKTKTRAQRFYINENTLDHFNSGKGIMDRLMGQIPGKNNYGAYLLDNSFDMHATNLFNGSDLNTAYYHRYFHNERKGAMGGKNIHRGFSDTNLWVAQTTHPEVAPMSVKSKHCHSRSNAKWVGKKLVCLTWTRRYTYALPLEVVFMTPLQTWNPYDIATDVNRATVTSGGRNGGTTPDKAYNGTCPNSLYYLTPSSFYGSGKVEKDKADTAKVGAGVLDKNGTVRVVGSSGVRIKTPNIGGGVGSIRLRYPIMSVHGEGSGVWKELNALKDMTMKMNRYGSLFEENPTKVDSENTQDNAGYLHMKTSNTVQDPPGEHSHDIILSPEEQDAIRKGEILQITTSLDMGHTHDVVLRSRPQYIIDRGWVPFRVRMFDGRGGKKTSWDGHTLDLEMSDD